MANGVGTNNLDSVPLSDEVLVNKEGSTGRQKTEDLATQLAGSGAIAQRLSPLETRATDLETSTVDQETRLAGLENGTYAEAIPFATTAAGIADTVQGQRFKVDNADPDVAYDVYLHDAGDVATFIESHPSVTALVTKISRDEGVAQNMLFDAWNEHTSQDADFGGWDWLAGGWGYNSTSSPKTFTTSDANIATGGTSKITESAGVLTDKYWPFEYLGLAEGQTVTISVLVYAAATGARVSAYFRDASNAVLGAANSAISTVSGAQVLTVSLVVPAGAIERLMIRVENASGDYEIAAYSVARGTANGAFRSAALPIPFLPAGQHVANKMYDPFGELIDAATRLDALSVRPAEFEVYNIMSENSPWGGPSIAHSTTGALRRYVDLANIGVASGKDKIRVRVASHFEATGGEIKVFLIDADGAVVRQHLSGPMDTGYSEFTTSLLDTTNADYAIVIVEGTMARELLAIGVSDSLAIPSLSPSIPVSKQVHNRATQNLHPDPFWRRYISGETAIDGLPTVNAVGQSGVVVTQDEASKFYDQNVLLVPSSADNYIDHTVSAAKLGLSVGDQISVLVGIHVPGGSGVFRLSCFWRAGVGGSVIESATVAVTPESGGYSVLRCSNTVTQAMVDGATVLTVRLNAASSDAFTGGYMVCGIGVFVNNESPVLVDQHGQLDDLALRTKHIEDTVNGLDGAARPEFKWGEWLLRETRQRLRRLSFGDNQKFVIACIGDSWTHNSGRYSGILATVLQDEFGDGGAGWLGLGFPTGLEGMRNGNAISWGYGYNTPTGTWTGNYARAVSPDLCSIVSSQAGSRLTITGDSDPVISGVDLYYIGTADGVVQYRWNDGSWASLNVQGALDDLHWQALSDVPTSGAWTLEIEVVSGTVELCGINIKSAADGVTLHKLGATGSRAQQWATVDATKWQSGIANLAPNLVTIMHGTNDQGSSRTPAQFAADIGAIIDRVRAAVPVADILVVMPCENQAGRAVAMSDYTEEVYSVCVSKRCAFMDLQAVFGDDPADYAAGSDRPWFNVDKIHPEPATGGRAIVDAIVRLLTVQ